jgi:hypothetical protein
MYDCYRIHATGSPFIRVFVILQGSLETFLKSEEKLDPNLLMTFINGIIAGMIHLHSEGILLANTTINLPQELFTEIWQPEISW